MMQSKIDFTLIQRLLDSFHAAVSGLTEYCVDAGHAEFLAHFVCGIL